MILGAEEPLLGVASGQEGLIVENWDNLDQWDINTYSPNAAYPAGGTAQVVSNNFKALTYPAGDGGPSLSIDGLSVGDFELSGNLWIVSSTNASNRAFAAINIFNTADETNDRLVIILGDSGTTSPILRVIQFVGGVSNTLVSQNGSINANQQIDFTITRTGANLNIDITGAFTVSSSHTISADAYDAINAQLGQLSGSTTNDQRVGPLTLEY